MMKDRIIAKITASVSILGTLAIMVYEPEILQNGVKEIALVIIGGALGFLFQVEKQE